MGKEYIADGFKTPSGVDLAVEALLKGGYTGNAKDLENLITAASTGASGISIVPTSPAPAGTGIASFTATQAGTYTNYGGVVVAANSFAVISRSATGVFSISQTALDISSKVNIADVKKLVLKSDDINPATSKAVFYNVLGDRISKSNAVNKIISQFSTFSVFQSLHFAISNQVITPLLTPVVDVANFIRLVYGTNATPEQYLYYNADLVLTSKKAINYGWIRKTDIASLPNQLTFMTIAKTGSTTTDIVKMDYIPKATFVVGYSQTKTVGTSTMELNVITETKDWIFFNIDFSTTSATIDKYTTRLYTNGNAIGTNGNIDLLNYTTFTGLDDVNIALKSLGGINDATAATFDVIESVSIANSDNIVFIGDSYTESDYTLADKSYISKVSESLTYQVRNFAKSGDDAIEEIIRLNANEVRFNTLTGVKSFGSKYAVIILYANDSIYRYWNIDMFKENIRDLVSRLRLLGYEPIISAEYFLYSAFTANKGVADTSLMKDLADELQVKFIDVAETSLNFIKVKNNDFWFGSHPATRTNSVFWKPISDSLQSLPRATKSVKLFRNRFVESSFANDTQYRDETQKIQLYKEIRIGHNALTAANEIYYDRQSLLVQPIYETLNDEYLALQNSQSVSFARHCLAEFILPYDARNINNLRLKINTTDTIFPHVRVKKTPFAATYGTAFKYTGTPTVVIGDVYSVSSSDGVINGKTFTVTDDRSGYITGDGLPFAYPNLTSSGTLTRTSGTGTSSISFNGVQGSFTNDYYLNYNNTYNWELMSKNADGFYYLDNSTKKYVEGDEIVFLIRNVSGFSMTGISLEIPKIDGATKVARLAKELKPYSTGAELLTQRFCGTSGELSGWTLGGTVTATQPIGNANPRLTSGKVNLTDINSITQGITYTSGINSQQVQIRIWANYEPPTFTGSSISTSTINSLSYDKSTLNIELFSDANERINLKREIGLGFQEVIINTFLPPDMILPKIRLSGTAKGVDVAYVSVTKI
jgi:hypothetical protein